MELGQDLLHAADAFRSVIDGGAVVDGGGVGAGVGIIVRLGGFYAGVELLGDFLVGDFHRLDHLGAEQLLLLGLGGVLHILFHGHALFFHPGLGGFVQSVAFQLGIGELLGLDGGQVRIKVGLGSLLHLSQLLLRQGGDIGSNMLLGHNVLLYLFDGGGLGGGNVVGVGGVIGLAEIDAVHIGHIIQLLLDGLLHLSLGLDGFTAAADDGGLGIHGLILHDQGTAAEQQGHRQHQRQQSFFLHGNLSVPSLVWRWAGQAGPGALRRKNFWYYIKCRRRKQAENLQYEKTAEKQMYFPCSGPKKLADGGAEVIQYPQVRRHGKRRRRKGKDSCVGCTVSRIIIFTLPLRSDNGVR